MEEYKCVVDNIRLILRNNQLVVKLIETDDGVGNTTFEIFFVNEGVVDEKEWRSNNVAVLICYYTERDRIIPLKKYNTRSVTAYMNYEANESDAKTLSISWIGVAIEHRSKKYGLLILIYCICYIYMRYKVEYVTLDDDSDRACHIKRNLYHLVHFETLPRDLIQLDLNNKRFYESTGGPERILPLILYSEKDYADMMNKLLLKKFVKEFNDSCKKQDRNPQKLALEQEQEKQFEQFEQRVEQIEKHFYLHEIAIEFYLANKCTNRWKRYASSMKRKRDKNPDDPSSSGTGGARVAKYTLKELKDIAVSNKIKITKKIDTKTLYLNKADLIKKLKKHGYDTICGLGKKEREINCGHSSPKRRQIIGDRAAKYTLKELKDIAVSNKIKITKKIDTKTLYLNKADLIKKLKKHGYDTICGLGKKEREINCGHSSPKRRQIIGDRAAKYTLKELKDIAVSNKIKITKKIDNKTLYLNKADLIKKHKLL